MDTNENTSAALAFYKALQSRNCRDTGHTSITFATEHQERRFTANVHLEVSGYDTPRLTILTELDLADVVPIDYKVRFGTWHFNSEARSLSITDRHPTHGMYETTFEICI